MEQFKSCERESKTRTFSKEGGPLTEDSEEKKEVRGWLQKTLRELRDQSDLFDSEIEQITSSMLNIY